MKKLTSTLRGAKKIAPFLLNRNVLLLVLAAATALGAVAPETATKLRNIVIELPASTGDLVG